MYLLTSSAVIFLSRFCDLNIQITIKVRLIIIYILFNNNSNNNNILCIMFSTDMHSITGNIIEGKYRMWH
jgi:hypothetical protein